MLAKDFHRVMLASDCMPLIERVRAEPGPLIGLLNHSSWWDPLLGMYLANRFAPHRHLLAPMELAVFRKFGMFKKLGIFGFEPDHPESLDVLKAYVIGCIERDPATTFWLTPQGQFADQRTAIRLRPGAGAIASAIAQRFGRPVVIAVAIEYVFWVDRKPEVIMRATEVSYDGDTSSLLGWTRAMTTAMRDNAARLAELAMARDDAPFTTLIGPAKASGKVNLFYDLWLKATGRAGAIQAIDRSPRRAVTSQPAGPDAGVTPK